MYFSYPLKVALAIMSIGTLVACESYSPELALAYKPIKVSNAHNHYMWISTVKSFKEQSQNNLYMQQEDYSCGAASLATLMSFYFLEQVNEKDILATAATLFAPDELEVIEEAGLSLKELDIIAKLYGYKTASARLTHKSIIELQAPVIVFLEREDYRHFAVLKTVHAGQAYLADPSRGNIVVPLSEFFQSWSGETFFMEKDGFTAAANHGLSIDKRGLISDLAVSTMFKPQRTTYTAKSQPRGFE